MRRRRHEASISWPPARRSTTNSPRSDGTDKQTYHFLSAANALVRGSFCVSIANFPALSKQQGGEGRISGDEAENDKIIMRNLLRVLVGMAEVVEVARVRVEEPKVVPGYADFGSLENSRDRAYQLT